MVKNFRLPALKLAESKDGVSDKIQLFRVGKFYHSEYGKFEITSDMLKAMEKNFKDKIRGVDIPVNYQHDSESVAAGWMRDVYLSQDGKELWADVDWTPNGKKVLTDKEFRYISPEFSYEYQDNESLKKFGPTLLGAGLTNIPTIKNMEPVVQLSEYHLANDLDLCVKELIPDLINQGHPQDQAIAIAYSKCRKEMGLSEPSKELGGKDSTTQTKLTNLKGVKPMDYASVDVEALSPEQLKALVKELLAKMKEAEGKSAMAEKQMADMQAEKKMAEKKSVFALMLSEGKVCKAQEEAYLSGDMVKFAELYQPIHLAEAGNSGKGSPAVSDPEDEVMRLAAIKLSEKSVKSLSDGISAVLKEKPELANKIYA